MVAFRDLKVSQDIAQWAELGKFEQEFIVYGCCYLHNGQRYYHISNQIVEVSRFAQMRLLEGIYTSPIVEWLNRVLVPSGLQEEYANISKVQLAQRMQELYPKSFLEEFNRLAETPHTDAALPILTWLQYALIACFDHKVLELAEGIALVALQQKKLTLEKYEAFKAWIDDRYLQMADDVVVKKEVKRTFFGFAYKMPDGRHKYYCNAFESEAYKRRDELMCKGQFCTPIISENCYYEQMPNMAEERKNFLAQLEQWMDAEYWSMIERICDLPAVISEKTFSDWSEGIGGQRGLENFVHYYKTLWQV